MVGARQLIAYSRALSDHIMIPVLEAVTRPQYGPLPRRIMVQISSDPVLSTIERERYARDLLVTSCAGGPGDVSGGCQRSGGPSFGVRIADVGYRAGAGAASGEVPEWRGDGRHRGRIAAAHV